MELNSVVSFNLEETGSVTFLSETKMLRTTHAYDRAHLVLKIMAKAKPTSFAREINRKVYRALKACNRDMEDGVSFAEGVDPVPLLFSKSSSQLFQLMISYMSKRGTVMSGGEGTLKVLQRDVAATCVIQLWSVACALT